jgi:hypothetical protein
MSEANLSGSYNTAVLSMSGTAQAMAGYSSSLTSTFNSTHIDVTVITQAADFRQSTDCFTDKNIDPAFLRAFQSLAAIDKPSSDGQWSPYVLFLKSYGSHIMIQQQIGSRFQQWESSASTDSDIAKTLMVKACAEVEGVGTGGGWSVNTCAAYSSDEKKKALQVDTQSQRVILGSTDAARAAITKSLNQATLDQFIDGASQGTEAVRFMFAPIWELLQLIFQPPCASAGKGSPACANLQRAINLQAAYEGWSAIGCPYLVDGRGQPFQSMVANAADTLGISTYGCQAWKTGCRTDDDCHLSAGSACYCYGSGCITQGDAIAQTFRDIVQGGKSGSYDEGVNISCYYHVFAHCDCHSDWAGGLPARMIYQQNTSRAEAMAKRQ